MKNWTGTLNVVKNGYHYSWGKQSLNNNNDNDNNNVISEAPIP